MLRLLAEEMRPRQWTKNLFVFVAVIFSHRLSDRAAVLASIAGFCFFCLISSAVYIINDIADVERDRQHPEKCSRPIASGRLSAPVAGAAAALLLGAGLGLSFMLAVPFGLIALAYLALNLAYSFSLKHIVIVDVLCIAIFFVLRAIAGMAAIGQGISHWLLICTILLALFIALVKRRHELVLLSDGAANHRVSLTEYSPYLLDQMIGVVTATTLMAYCLYTVDPATVAKFGSDRLVYTVPFVIFGIFQYLYLVHQKGEGGSPDRMIVSDKPFLANLLFWIAVAGTVIYSH